MDATVVREQITEQLLRKLEGSRFPHAPLMNRIEARIKTRDELERYVEVLVAKLEDTDFRSEAMLDRIDRILGMLERSASRR